MVYSIKKGVKNEGKYQGIIISMIKLEIKFSREYEIQRISETIKRIDFYREHKYNIRFPEKLSIDFNTNVSNIPENQIKDAVELEFKEDDYLAQKTFLLENWPKLMNEIAIELSKTDLKFLEIYNVNLTKYGVGGSYHYPDIIVSNIKNSYNIGLLRTILHETIHLGIHPWIEKHKIDHWQKERIVDLLMSRISPRLSKFQQVPIQTENIDKIFNDNYPNVEKLIEAIH